MKKHPKKEAGAKTSASVKDKPAKAVAADQAHAETTKQSKADRRREDRAVLRPLPSAFSIAKKALQTLWLHKKIFLGITGIYLLLTIIFVRGLSGGTNLTELKAAIGDVGGGFTQLTAGLALFTVLLTTSGNNSSETAGAYQSFLLLIVSLATIWALRHVMAGEAIRIRDAFYSGMYPLIPVVLVLAVVGLQLLPMLIGAVLYSLVVTNGIAVSAPEQLFWAGLFFVLGLASLYMIASSIFAVYIAALPDMTPMKALRSARDLVRHRRWPILRKLLFLPVALILAAAFVMLPIILLLTPLAPWVFFILSALSIILIHGYLYTLYRELLP